MSLNRKSRHSRSLFILSFIVLTAVVLPSESFARKSQMHARTGNISGHYDGTFKGEFQVNAAFDLDYELFVANDGSVLFRFIQALDWPETRPFYTYAGLGSRYYWGSKGSYSIQDDPGIYISAKPRVRFYFGSDLGTSQVIVKTFGPIVQAVSNMVDVGFNFGSIYQLSDNLGLEGQIGASYGYGISSTQATGYTTRLLFGASYFF